MRKINGDLDAGICTVFLMPLSDAGCKSWLPDHF